MNHLGKTILGAAVAGSLWLFAGCVHQPIDVSAQPGERRIKPDDIVLVRLAPETAARVDSKIYLTGPIWKSVFVGDAGSPWTFAVKKAESRLEVPPQGLGFVVRYVYVADGVLSGFGKEFEIHSEGGRGTGMNTASAHRQSIELAVIDAARQCQRIVDLESKTAAATVASEKR